MLGHRSLIRFPITFLFALAILLALSLEVHGVIGSQGQFTHSASIASRLQADLVAAAYFLVLSGYLPLFLLSYFAFTRKATRQKKLLASVLLMVASYLFFLFLFADVFAAPEALLLVLSIVSVAAADSVAEVLDRPRRSS